MSRLSIDETENIIANSLEIYERKIEDLKRKGNNYVGLCPLHGEKTPSFNINSEHPNLFKCFGCGESGNVISFISKLHNLTYKEAIDYINGMKIVYSKQPIVNKKEKKPLVVDWVEQKFTDQHKRYFDNYELDETFLNSRDIWALKTLAINKRIQKFPDYQFKFAYYAKDLDQIKVLTLGKEVSKDEKWRSYNIPNTYLWDYWRYKDSPCENLFVVKSNKDGAVLAKLGKCAIELQSEDAKIFLENNVEKVKQICKNPIICTGTDEQGFNTSLNITKSTGFRWFNTKKKYLRMYDVKDVSDLVSVFSLKKLEQELKDKNL
jgi:hypothetical protein